jgi:hypothetical protein
MPSGIGRKDFKIPTPFTALPVIGIFNGTQGPEQSAEVGSFIEW